MALIMARPWQDPKTGVWHLRQRTPRDLLGRLRGSLVSLPVGDEFVTVKVGDLVQASLRTKDAQEAKRLHAAADAALRQRWELERSGPTPLSQLQVQALAGDWRRAIVAEYRENPGDRLGRECRLDRRGT